MEYPSSLSPLPWMSNNLRGGVLCLVLVTPRQIFVGVEGVRVCACVGTAVASGNYEIRVDDSGAAFSRRYVNDPFPRFGGRVEPAHDSPDRVVEILVVQAGEVARDQALSKGSI